jgi:ribosomal protein S18 acetylase RimI-like enzyme
MPRATGLDLCVRPLTEENLERAAWLLAHAFEVDEAYRYLFPDSDARTRGLHDFFAGNLRTHLPHRCTYVAQDGAGRVLATVTLRPPGGVHISLWTMLHRGLLPFALAHGYRAVQRLFWLKHTYDALEAAAADAAPHAHVHMMAVVPEQQGQGVGSRLLAHVLGVGAAVTARHPTVLTTHLPRNLTFYRLHGFEVVSERPLQPPGGKPYTVWSMRK